MKTFGMLLGKLFFFRVVYIIVLNSGVKESLNFISSKNACENLFVEVRSTFVEMRVQNFSLPQIINNRITSVLYASISICIDPMELA